MSLKHSRWLRILTVEHRYPVLYSLPRVPPVGRTVECIDGSIEVVEVRDWFCNPQHVEHFRAQGATVKADPHCPLWSTTRRWRWER